MALNERREARGTRHLWPKQLIRCGYHVTSCHQGEKEKKEKKKLVSFPVVSLYISFDPALQNKKGGIIIFDNSQNDTI
jgi:hypothetical protein